MNAILFVTVLGSSSLTMGRILLRGWRKSKSQGLSADALRDFVQYGALGLLFQSYLLFLLATFHYLQPQVVRIFFGGQILLALYALKDAAKFRSSLFSKLDFGPVSSVLILFYYFWIFLCATLPAYSVDEIIYHLVIPKKILEAGGWSLFADNMYAYFPQCVELLFTLALSLGQETSARCIHTLFGLLMMLVLYASARRQNLSSRWAFGAAAIFATLPTVMIIQSQAYVDLAFVLFSFLSFSLLMESLKESKPPVSLAVLAGIFAGAAGAVKYTGIQFSMISIAVWAIFSRRMDFSQRIKFLITYGTVTLALCAPYWIRNIIETGWPLFPFQIGKFSLKEGINWNPERAHLYLQWLGQFGTELGHETASQKFLAPILVFLQGRFDSIRYYDGILGPLFLLTPVAMWNLRKKEAFWPVMVFVGFFIYYWALSTKQARFLLPALPWAGLLIAAWLSSYRSKIPAILLSIYLAVMFGVGAGQALKAKPLNYWAKKESREQFLARQHASYHFYNEVNQRLKPPSKLFLINMKNYGYWLQAPFTTDYLFERYRLDQLLDRPDASAESCREFFRGLGITHLMMDEAYVTSKDFGFFPKQMEVFRNFIASDAHLIFRDGPYALYSLEKK